MTRALVYVAMIAASLGLVLYAARYCGPLGAQRRSRDPTCREPSEAEYDAALVGYWEHKHALCHESSLRAAIRAAARQRSKDAAKR